MKDKKKAPLFAPFSFGANNLSATDIGALAKSDPDAFGAKLQEAVENGDLSWSKITNLPALYHGLRDVRVKTYVEDVGEKFAVTASAFPILSGTLTVAALNEAFENEETIGEQLTTPLNDPKKVTTIVGIESLDNGVERVDETQDFPEIGASEEKYQILSNKNGRILRISKEMIAENDVAGILDRVNALARISSNRIEGLTLKGVTDHFGSASTPAEPYTLRFNGSNVALFTTSANSPGEGAPSGTRVINNALVDETDLDAAYTRLSTFLDDLGERIAIPASKLQMLIPFALQTTAFKLLNSIFQPGIENEINVYGPNGARNPKVVTSTRMDDLSVSAWYLGDFKSQFTRKWKAQLEFMSLGMDSEAYLRAEIAFQSRVSWDAVVGARSYRRVVQCLSGTTAPFDE